MAKNCKNFLQVQKLSPFFAPYGDHYDPIGGSAGGEIALIWSAIKTTKCFYAFYW